MENPYPETQLRFRDNRTFLATYSDVKTQLLINKSMLWFKLEIRDR